MTMVVEYDFREYKLAKLSSKIDEVRKKAPKVCHLVTLSLKKTPSKLLLN